LHGVVDAVLGAWKIEGWAHDPDHPDLPVLLEVCLDDRVIGTVLACDAREDLAQAGIGRGRCAFFFNSPERLKPELLGTLRIRRVDDHAELPMTDDCLARIEEIRREASGQPRRKGIRLVA
jgi:hypothetical protein